MIIISVLVLLLGAAFIVHTIRIIKLNKDKGYEPRRFMRVLPVIGIFLVVIGIAGIFIDIHVL